MREWHFLPEKDGDHYTLRVVDIYRDDALFVDYEIYRNEENTPIEIDFFQKEIDELIKEIKDEYIKEELAP